MRAAYVRATALASALGTDLPKAVARLLAGSAAAPRSLIGRPYHAIPLEEGDWWRRARSIAQTVAAELQRDAGLPAARWAGIPCVVGSSSFSIGAAEADEAALEPPVAFCRALAQCFGAGGPVLGVSTACTSGLSALHAALDLLEQGPFDDVLVLGVELSNRLSVAGFAGLELLSPALARPCDRRRDGMVLGEALGAILVSARPAAWRVAGLAAGVDASSVFGPEPGGGAVAAIMRAAIERAGWRPPEVDLIKLQAAGSPLADLAEARAVRSLFAAPPRLTSLKGAIGHTLGASGTAELALLLGALAHGAVPPTAGYEMPDPELGLAPCGGDGSDARRVLFNLSGFGGSVMALALERAG
jgi:3-oxoacyl-[acyl-carrier-protein] synthase-1